MPLCEATSIPSRHTGIRESVTVWCIVAAIAFGLYAATANRGIQWQDSGWQQYRIATGTIKHGGGLALTHPLQYFLGRGAIAVLPFEPAFCTTLMSALAASVAIANIFVLIAAITRRRFIAAICAAALLLSHTFWQLATHTETYTLVLALLSAEWLCLYRYAESRNGKWLLGVALFNGLGVANHMLASLVFPVDAVIICIAARRKALTSRQIVAAALIWLAATLPYSLLILKTAIQTGDWGGAIHSALFGKFAHGVLNTSLSLRSLSLSFAYIAYNFPGLTILLAAHVVFRRVNVPSIFLVALRCQLVIFLLFVVRYAIVDQFTFYLPVYGLLAILAGIGLNDCMKRFSHSKTRALIVIAAITALWTPLVYAGTTYVLSSRGFLKSLVGNKPYRDGYSAFFKPWGIGKDYAEQLNRDAFTLAGPDGVILLEDSMMKHAVLYGQLRETHAQATEIVCAFAPMKDDESRVLLKKLSQHYAQGHPIILVPRDRDNPQTLTSCCTWQREGDLYILEAINSDCD